MNARVHPEATAASLSEGADYELLAQRFRPIFARIAEGAVERERQRELPHEAIAWLKQAGFGAVRVPREHGGAGASLPQLVQLLIELAEADSNITQALRGHFAFVEDRLNAEPGPGRDRWLQLMSNALEKISPEQLPNEYRAAIWEHMERVANMLINAPSGGHGGMHPGMHPGMGTSSGQGMTPETIPHGTSPESSTSSTPCSARYLPAGLSFLIEPAGLMWSVVTESPSLSSTRAPSTSETGVVSMVMPSKYGGLRT